MEATRADGRGGAGVFDGAALAGKYLTFSLGDEEYGLPVLQVREIITVLDITPVPQMPAHVKGVINLRGKVIPVIDLRLKLGLPERAYTDRTCIIVVDGLSASGPASGAQRGPARERVLLGIVVDTVSEVLTITAAEIEPTPDFGARIATGCLLGLATVKHVVTILLDLDGVLGAEGLPDVRPS